VTLIWAGIAAATAALAWREWRRGGPRRWQLPALGYLVAGLTALTVGTRVTQGRWLGSFFGERYFYAPKLLFVLLVAWLFTAGWERASKRARRRAGALLAVYALLLSYAERGRYASDAEAGRRVAALAERAAALEAERGGRRGIDLLLERERGEPIHLRAPAENLPCEVTAPAAQ
jgi:hypothetical protein